MDSPVKETGKGTNTSKVGELKRPSPLPSQKAFSIKRDPNDEIDGMASITDLLALQTLTPNNCQEDKAAARRKFLLQSQQKFCIKRDPDDEMDGMASITDLVASQMETRKNSLRGAAKRAFLLHKDNAFYIKAEDNKNDVSISDLINMNQSVDLSKLHESDGTWAVGLESSVGGFESSFDFSDATFRVSLPDSHSTTEANGSADSLDDDPVKCIQRTGGSMKKGTKASKVWESIFEELYDIDDIMEMTEEESERVSHAEFDFFNTSGEEKCLNEQQEEDTNTTKLVRLPGEEKCLNGQQEEDTDTTKLVRLPSFKSRRRSLECQQHRLDDTVAKSKPEIDEESRKPKTRTNRRQSLTLLLSSAEEERRCSSSAFDDRLSRSDHQPSRRRQEHSEDDCRSRSEHHRSPRKGNRRSHRRKRSFEVNDDWEFFDDDWQNMTGKPVERSKSTPNNKFGEAVISGPHEETGVLQNHARVTSRRRSSLVGNAKNQPWERRIRGEEREG